MRISDWSSDVCSSDLRRRFWRNDLTAAAFPGRNRRNIASILILTGGIAAAEVLLGFGPGHFLIRERAEPDAFLAFRPWLIGLALASAVLLTGAWRTAAAGAALFMITATVADWRLLSVTGAPDLLVLGRAAGLRPGRRGGGALAAA